MLRIPKQRDKFSSKRQKGVYKTPYKTAQHMVDLIYPYITNQSKILDPCVGDGVFIETLIEKKIDPSKITAYDINKEKIDNLNSKGIHTKCTDTLLAEYPKKDIILGNPPYKSRRENIYMKKHQKELQDKYGFIGLYNLYSLFIVNAIQHLKRDGVLCFIVEDAFFTNRYYFRLRKYLLDNCKIIELKLAPWRLFHRSKADVRTVIITLQKRKHENSPHQELLERDKKHQMRLVDRLTSENEYENPPEIQLIPQIEYRKMPDLKFFVGIPESIIALVQNPPNRFGDIVQGGTGISTGNDQKYLRRHEEVKNDPYWVGFYKSGPRTPYYYETPYYIEKNYHKNMKLDPKNFLVRNEQFFFREGITCSSVGRKFTAAYLPKGNLFGVNANFFFETKEDLYFNIGYLNSKFVQYLARKVIHRSNIIATSFIKELPFVIPSINQKKRVVQNVKQIITKLMNNPNYNYSSKAEQIDKIIFDIYDISDEIKKKIVDFCTNIIDRV